MGKKTEDDSIYFNFEEIIEDDQTGWMECEYNIDSCSTNKTTATGR